MTPTDAAVSAVPCPQCAYLTLNRFAFIRWRLYCMMCGHRPHHVRFARRRGQVRVELPAARLRVEHWGRQHAA